MIAPLPFAALEAGHRLVDRFLIHREIGRGGHSIVYAARDLTVDADVALKLLVPSPNAAAEAKERLRREVQLARGLRHPNIVGVHDFVEIGASSLVVMDLIDGTDLASLIRSRGAFAPEEACRIAVDVAAALVALHRAGILHRDLKPANILIDRTGRALLADFGSARLDGQATLTRTGGLVGTVAYLAPEVWAGQRPDIRADLYALGVTLYEMLTGSLPPQASPHLPPVPRPDGFHPATVRKDVAPWLDEAVAMLTRTAPRHRFATAEQVRETIDQRRVPAQPVIVAELAAVRTGRPATLRTPLAGRLLIMAVVVAGVLAGFTASAHFLWATPVVALIVWRGVRVRKPADAPLDLEPRRWELIGPLGAQYRNLPPGTAKSLLDDILVLARAQVEGAPSSSPAGEWRTRLEPLVATAVTVAKDLAGVDDALGRMADTAGRLSHVPAGYWSSVTDLERTRDGLSTVLLELLATLGRARGAQVDDFDSARFRMEELLGELRGDLDRSIEAAREVEAALRAG